MFYDSRVWSTIGFEKIKKAFSRLRDQNNLGHAYLFTGQDMIGKRTFALELVKKINAMHKLPQEHPDVFYISNILKEDGKISIEQARNLKKFLALKPYFGPYKFAIIDNAHEMTHEAGHSILKVLEEPPANSVLILISSQPRQILPTVLSRCETVKFCPHKTDILERYFRELGLNAEQIKFLVRFSNGRIGMAIDLHKNNSFSMIKKVIEDFQKMLKMPLYQKFEHISLLLNDKLAYDAKTALLYWMLYARSSGKISVSQAAILRRLLKLYHYIDQPQLNHKLIFENEFVKI